MGSEKGSPPVDNSDIAGVFQEIADMLELKKDNIFKIRAYRKVAASIEQLPVPLAELAAGGRLREVPGVGEAVEKKIEELLATGKLDYYDRLKAESPAKGADNG
ncbi:MAG: hypothetical protein V1691_02145 [Chloroflexota bacterium]